MNWWILLIIVAFVVGIPLGKKLYTRKEQWVEERKAALTIAVMMREYGLQLFPKAYEDFAVGNITDLFKQFRNLAEIAKSGKEVIEKELNGVFERVLDSQLDKPAGLALIKAKVAVAEGKKA